MEELFQFLQDQFAEDSSITITGSQHHRTHQLEFNWIPENQAEFYAVVNKAPWTILKGLGFGKWDTMNNLIKENNGKPKSDILEIPILNAAGENLCVNLGATKGVPTELLNPDEDVILFPGEWFDIIPEGFEVTDINGLTYRHNKETADDDIRYGCLAYGIRRPVTFSKAEND